VADTLGGAPAPRLADLDVFDSPHWLGHLSLLEAIEDGLDFRYLIYGRALAAYYGRDLKAKPPVTCRPRSAIWSAANISRPMPTNARFWSSGAPASAACRFMIAKLILPLSNDGRAIDLLLAAGSVYSPAYAAAAARLPKPPGRRRLGYAVTIPSVIGMSPSSPSFIGTV
jgi:hypothetical protein